MGLSRGRFATVNLLRVTLKPTSSTRIPLGIGFQPPRVNYCCCSLLTRSYSVLCFQLVCRGKLFGEAPTRVPTRHQVTESYRRGL